MHSPAIQKTFVFAAIAVAILASTCQGAQKLPAFDKVDAIVRRHFASLPGFEQRDLISQTQVKPIFRATQLLGWTVADDASILNSVLPDNNYLVVEFRKPAGRKFMRKISGEKLAYDRLDQMARMPGGKLMIKDFLRFPNGDLTFTSKSPLEVNRLARLQGNGNRNQADLDQPTGRIYTVDDLVARLRVSYEAEVAKRKQLTR